MSGLFRALFRLAGPRFGLPAGRRRGLVGSLLSSPLHTGPGGKVSVVDPHARHTGGSPGPVYDTLDQPPASRRRKIRKEVHAAAEKLNHRKSSSDPGRRGRQRGKPERRGGLPALRGPGDARQGFWPITLVLLGFTFFSATMWGGGSLGVAFRFWPDLVGIILCGSAILAVYVAGLGYVGYKSGLSTVLSAVSASVALRDAGGGAGLLTAGSAGALTVAEALTIVVGTFVSGGTQVANWTRFSGSARVAVGSTLLAFFFGNGLMIAAGAVGATVYGLSDIVEVLAAQGLLVAGVLMLFSNIWTTQDNIIYNFSVAGCHFCRTERRRLVTFVGAAAGTLLALLGMYDWLIPYMVAMGVLIPPLGGVIMADFFVRHRGRYPALGEAIVPRFNRQGLGAYAAGSLAALVIPGIPPVNGIVAAFVVYACLARLT